MAGTSFDRDLFDFEDPHMWGEGKTNFWMYKEIAALYEKNKQLDFEVIDKVFGLEGRDKRELENLREFVIVITLMCGQDVLKAQIEKNGEKEKAEIKKHEIRCGLMTVLLEAIDVNFLNSAGGAGRGLF